MALQMKLSISTEKILEWTATTILLTGVFLTSWDIYPLNLYFSFIGNAMWAAIGIAWRKWGLAFGQIVISLIYTAGILRTLYHVSKTIQ